MSKTSRTILTMEDDLAVRASIVGYLEDRGYTMLQAINGREGLEIFYNEKPDLVLVDLRMPEIDGYEVLKTITEEAPEIPIIVVSGTGVIGNAIDALRQGAWDYILKPIEDMAILLHAVEKVLERARLVEKNKQYQEHLEELVHLRTQELEEANKALEDYQEHLEELVEQRTEELEKSHQKLRQSERLASIGTLAAGIAHEINNPLGMMLLDVDDALLADLSPDIRTNLVQIKSNIERCSTIVKSVLQFAKEQPSEKQPLELNKVINKTTDLIRASLERYKIELKKDLCSEELPVFGNQIQLQQVFINLIENSLNFCPPGGAVSITSRKIHGAVKVVIADNGAGMSQEQCEHVFEPFYTTRLHKGGTGLGMSIVHGIVGEHNGSISVESREGQGTSVTIEYPEYLE